MKHTLSLSLLSLFFFLFVSGVSWGDAWLDPDCCEEWKRQNSPQLSGLGHRDRNSLHFPEAANRSGVELSWKRGWNHLQNPNKSAGPAVPHLMILKGKCEIVEMLMGLGGPLQRQPIFPKTPEQGWEVSGNV